MLRSDQEIMLHNTAQVDMQAAHTALQVRYYKKDTIYSRHLIRLQETDLNLAHQSVSQFRREQTL